MFTRQELEDGIVAATQRGQGVKGHPTGLSGTAFQVGDFKCGSQTVRITLTAS